MSVFFRRSGKPLQKIVFDVIELETRVMPAVFKPTFVLYHPGGENVPFTSAGSPSGLTPSQMRSAYGVNLAAFGSVVGDGTGQTIAIVDAYRQPNIASDLAAFDSYYGLAAPPSFLQRNESGGATLPSVDSQGGWGVETSLDVEWAHVIAPNATILLIETNSDSDSDLMAGVNAARNFFGVSVVSMSWGSDESPSDSSDDSHFTTPTGHIGVTFVASSGDNGSYSVSDASSQIVQYPAASPNIVAVGGTTLNVSAGGTYLSESGWGDGTNSFSNGGSGGGISQYASQPSYQAGVVTQSSTQRTVPDVALDADPNTGVSIYDTYDNSVSAPWAQYGGTSLAAPMWAGVIAIANQGRVQHGLATLDGPSGTLPKLYALPAADFHDITTGNNGYAAGPGYDLVTGRGTPIVNLVVSDLARVPVSVTGVSPNSGPVSGGTSVVITGTGFTAATAVLFGSTNATAFTINSDTQITATSPPGAGVVDVTVVTSGASPVSNADHFTYLGAAVTSVSPNNGPLAGGTSVTITGSGFTGATAVQFGANSATTYVVNSDTQIIATAPASTGIVDVTVTTPVGGTSATTSGDLFTYVGSPTVTGLNPTTGPAAGGTSVVITGTNFIGVTSVMFGTTNATAFTVNSPTQITATAPAGSGVIDVTITASGGTSVISTADQFTYVAAPIIAALIPPSGPVSGGATVVLTGVGFTGATFVKFGAVNATAFTVDSDTQITATAPAGAGVVDVTVTIPVGGTSAITPADQFTYLGAVVTGLSPNFGPVGGGTTVVITGSGFTGATAVSFGAANATAFTVVSDTQITAIAPAGVGVVDVTVTTPVGGTSAISNNDHFTYSVVVTASPANIADSSSTITINGGGFSPTPANNSVTFNLGVVGTVTAATANQLTVTVSAPPTALGSLTAVVTSSGFNSGTPVQVGTEVNGNWVVTDASVGTGTFTDLKLPYAVAQALNGDQISFAAGLSGSTITLSSTLTISHNLTITGLGAANLAVSGNASNQVFLVNAGVTATISGLTIENGQGSSGGGVQNLGTLTLSADTITGNTSFYSGGGVFNTGTLTVINSTFSNNTALYGGGLANSGPATVTGSTFNGNSATGTGGGAIINYMGTLSLSNSTLVNNTAYTGGGIENYSGTVRLSNDTIAYNTATSSGGGGIYNLGTMSLLNTIVSGNHLNGAANDVNGTIALANNNVIGTTSGMFITTGTGNHLNVSAGLATTLANNGGPTQTLALLPGSIALGAGGALTTVASAHPIGVSDLTLFVANASAIAQTAGNIFILIGQEQMLVTNVNTSTNTLTVQRGVNGTTPAAHAVGASVFFATDQRGVTRLTPADIGAYQRVGATATTLIDNGPSPSLSGQAVSFTATLAGGSEINGETITIEDASNANAVVAAPTLVSGTVTFTLANLSVGTHSLFAVYGGDTTHAASNSSTRPVTQIVNPAAIAPVVTSVIINGGAPAYLDANNVAVSLLGQNSVVEQILVTFNEPVTLDDGAFTITNDAANVQVLGGIAVPNADPVGLNAPLPVPGSGGTQFILTFLAGSGTTAIPGGAGALIDDGVYTLNTIGSKVHANGQTAADNNTGFWALFGSVAADNRLSNNIGDGTSEILVDTPDAAQFKIAFTSENDSSLLPDVPYDPAMDSNLTGVIDTPDAAKFKHNFGTDWVF